jgi:hypothetical protein
LNQVQSGFDNTILAEFRFPESRVRPIDFALIGLAGHKKRRFPRPVPVQAADAK